MAKGREVTKVAEFTKVTSKAKLLDGTADTSKAINLMEKVGDTSIIPEFVGDLKENEIYIDGKGYDEQTIIENIGDRYTLIEGGELKNERCINVK